MNTPAISALRLATALATGMGLGLFHGFLRPLRRPLPHFSDFLFVMAAVAGWIFVSFPVCQGDIRAVFLLAMALGTIAWEKTIGRLLRPIFATFWLPLEKFFYFINFFAKKFFATAKKWVTINGVW